MEDNNQIKSKRERFNNQLSLSLPKKSSSAENSVDTLIFILHGDNEMKRQNDFESLKATFEEITKSTYTHIKGRIEYHVVSCENLCRQTLMELSSLEPFEIYIL